MTPLLSAADAADQRALRHGVGAVLTGRDVVEVSGPDAATFLQGQVSQDVDALDVGTSAWTFVLHPDGKVAVWARLNRAAPDRFVVDLDGGFAQALVARLERFKLRIDCSISVLDWGVLAIRGPGSADVDPGPHLAASPEWPGVQGVDLLGPELEVPSSVRSCSLEAYEALRIEAGVPGMGSELTDRTIPAEAGVVDRSVSFTKGCFTGQELVARIDSRGGNVPRHLSGVVLHAGGAPDGAELWVDEALVGTVTSTAVSAELGAPVALAYVARSVSPPTPVTVRWDKGEATAEVRSLPLVGP